MLSLEAKKDLQWWVSFIPIGKPMHPPTPSEFVTTDASKAGWGATWGNHTVSGSWHQETPAHINWLELRAIFFAFKEWAPLLRGKTVAVQSDNKTAVAYIMREGGTRSRCLMDLTHNLLQFLD